MPNLHCWLVTSCRATFTVCHFLVETTIGKWFTSVILWSTTYTMVITSTVTGYFLPMHRPWVITGTFALCHFLVEERQQQLQRESKMRMMMLNLVALLILASDARAASHNLQVSRRDEGKNATLFGEPEVKRWLGQLSGVSSSRYPILPDFELCTECVLTPCLFFDCPT